LLRSSRGRVPSSHKAAADRHEQRSGSNTKIGRRDYEREDNDATGNDWAGPDGRQHGAATH
jgi:hypothetical protein